MTTALNTTIPDQCVINYLDALVGKIYKILPMKEDGAEFLPQYIEWRIREMTSFRDFVRVVGEDADFLSLLLIMHSLSEQEELSSVRHDVFEAISLCKKLRKKYGGQEGGADGRPD